MDYVLRKAKATDTTRIAELFVEMQKAIYHTDHVESYETGYLDKFFSGKEDWICVAEHEHHVVAFLSIEVHRDEDLIYLDDFSVAKKYRKKGIGTKLIHAAETYAEEIGVAKIALHIEKTNTDAYRFYSRLGYREEVEEGNRIRMNKSIQSYSITKQPAGNE